MKAKIGLLITLCNVGINASAQSATYSTQAITKDLAFFKDWAATEWVGHFKSKQLEKFQSPLMKQLATKIGKSNLSWNKKRSYSQNDGTKRQQRTH